MVGLKRMQEKELKDSSPRTMISRSRLAVGVRIQHLSVSRWEKVTDDAVTADTHSSGWRCSKECTPFRHCTSATCSHGWCRGRRSSLLHCWQRCPLQPVRARCRSALKQLSPRLLISCWRTTDGHESTGGRNLSCHCCYSPRWLLALSSSSETERSVQQNRNEKMSTCVKTHRCLLCWCWSHKSDLHTCLQAEEWRCMWKKKIWKHNNLRVNRCSKKNVVKAKVLDRLSYLISPTVGRQKQQSHRWELKNASHVDKPAGRRQSLTSNPFQKTEELFETVEELTLDSCVWVIFFTAFYMCSFWHQDQIWTMNWEVTCPYQNKKFHGIPGGKRDMCFQWKGFVWVCS